MGMYCYHAGVVVVGQHYGLVVVLIYCVMALVVVHDGANVGYGWWHEL